MQLSEDILFYIGQKYLKDKPHIKELFYYNKDDKLQELLFGEVRYIHKHFPKTRISAGFLFPKRNPNQWMYINGTEEDSIDSSVDEYLNLIGEIFERIYDYEYHIYITYEIINDDLILKIEYVWLGFDEPAIYSIDRISFTIDNETINKYLPNIYKVLKQLIFKKCINFSIKNI